ncbi:MAG: rRNA pseudouridine synthase [Burkholderiales bacterium]|nr:rRNA pseudouridine synthase [Burkholderiales bacterium]
MTEPVRLAKRLAEIVPCSRREAELYVEGGWVTVDGQVVQEPQFRVGQQKIVLSPDATLAPVELVTMLYHQPPQATSEITADKPPINIDNHAAGDFTGIRPLKRHFSRLSVALPIEPNASGLVVFTQDWRVLRKLVDDAATVEQEYIVEVAGELGPHGLKQLNHGLSFKGRSLPLAKVSWQNEARLRFAVKAVQAGQIAHMCTSVGLTVQSIKRIRFGKISMAKLPPEQWRYLPADGRF